VASTSRVGKTQTSPSPAIVAMDKTPSSECSSSHSDSNAEYASGLLLSLNGKETKESSNAPVSARAAAKIKISARSAL